MDTVVQSTLKSYLNYRQAIDLYEKPLSKRKQKPYVYLLLKSCFMFSYRIFERIKIIYDLFV